MKSQPRQSRGELKRNPKARADGTGSEYKRKSDGRWVATYPMPPGPDGKRRRPKEFSARTKREAIAKRRDWIQRGGVEADERKERTEGPAPGSVAAVGKEWLAYLADHGRKRSTIAAYRSALNTHVKTAALGQLRIDKVKREHIENLQTGMRSGKHSMRTRQAVHTMLNGLFKYAVDRTIIETSPMERIKRPGGARQARVKQRERAPAWSVAETKKLLKVARERHYGPLIELMLDTGLRPGEAYALTWGCVNLSDRTLRVELELVDVDGRVTYETPKTEQARRTVKLSKSTCAMLERLHDSAGSTKRGDFVFRTGAGTPCDRNNVRRALAAMCTAAEVPIHTPHSCRHTHASQLLQAGVNIKVVSERLGHRDVKTTLDVYSHLLPGMGQAAADAVDRLRR